jgi:hypothetical protein
VRYLVTLRFPAQNGILTSREANCSADHPLEAIRKACVHFGIEPEALKYCAATAIVTEVSFNREKP